MLVINDLADSQLQEGGWQVTCGGAETETSLVTFPQCPPPKKTLVLPPVQTRRRRA